jgi:hypothetical protein
MILRCRCIKVAPIDYCRDNCRDEHADDYREDYPDEHALELTDERAAAFTSGAFKFLLIDQSIKNMIQRV